MEAGRQTDIGFRLLGPLEVLDASGSPVDLGGRQPRLVLALLLLAGGRSVTIDALVDAIWGDEPPASSTGTIQSYVSRLRRRLEDAGTGARLAFDDAGYHLDVDADRVDVHRFEAMVDEGRRLLDDGRLAEARDTLAAAEDLWRGPAAVEFADVDLARGVAARLDERRLSAAEARYAAELALGRHGAVIGPLAELAGAHPLREGLQQQLALALYRSGRQAEALRVLADAAGVLRDELGIEPSRPLRELESAILAHDRSLDALPADAAVAARSDVPAGNGGAGDAGGAGAPVPVVAPAAAPTGPPLVGRAPELALLLDALDAAGDDARFVVLEGDPGIGKSRLADELRVIAERRGSLAVWGRSDEGGAAPALWPWLPLLRALTERATSVTPGLGELVAGEAPLLAGQGAAVQFERFEAVAGLLEEAGAHQPAVVLLDDLQWADPASLELLAFLAGRLRAGVVVVATMRRLEVGRADAVTDALAAIARRPGSRRRLLTGLSLDATAELLAEAAMHPVGPQISAAIHARAEGNPFYAIELARLADEEGGLAGEVPGSVGDVIRRRLARLPQATVELLRAGAVTGRDVDLHLLARTTELDIDECLDLIEPAAVHRLLVDVDGRPGVLRFNHALVREVLLDGLTSLRRARLHLRVADAIEGGATGLDDAEILAEHLWQAAPVGVGRRAAEALERAAEVAISRVSYTSAEHLLHRAARLRRATGGSSEDQRAELATLVRLLEVTQATRYFQGADHDVLARADVLAEQFGLDDLVRRLFWFRWAALATSCQLDDTDVMAEGYLNRCLEDPRAEVQSAGHEVYGTSCWDQGRIADAVEHFDRSVALLDGAPPPEDAFAFEQRLVSVTFCHLCHALHGDRPESETFANFDQLIAASPVNAVPAICGFAGTTAAVLGRWGDVRRYYEVALAADPGSQFAFWGGQLLMYRGMVEAVEAVEGRVDAALASFDEGRNRYLGIGAHSGLPTFEASMAIALAGQGQVEAALRLAHDARVELDTFRERWNEPIVLIAEAVVAHAAGDPSRATGRLRDAVSAATAQQAHALARRAEALAADLGLTLG